MIEIQINKSGPVCNGNNEVLNSISMIKCMRTAGIPFEGLLLTRGIERGLLTWHTEEDLEADTWVIRWFDDGERVATGKLSDIMHKTRYQMIKWVQGHGFRWANLDEKPKEEDEEL